MQRLEIATNVQTQSRASDQLHVFIAGKCFTRFYRRKVVHKQVVLSCSQSYEKLSTEFLRPKKVSKCKSV